jgi:hypothetical protein
MSPPPNAAQDLARIEADLKGKTDNAAINALQRDLNSITDPAERQAIFAAMLNHTDPTLDQALTASFGTYGISDQAIIFHGKNGAPADIQPCPGNIQYRPRDLGYVPA